jgi:hypothetical protein
LDQKIPGEVSHDALHGNAFDRTSIPTAVWSLQNHPQWPLCEASACRLAACPRLRPFGHVLPGDGRDIMIRPASSRPLQQNSRMDFPDLQGDAFDRLERLIYRPVSTRPDWLKAWRNEANYLLFLARRASDDEDDELLEELEAQAGDMADMVEARFRAEGL